MEGHLAATKLSWKTLPMTEQHTTQSLDFTLDTSSPTYLGSSETVNRLVSEFCAGMLPLLSGQAESSADFMQKSKALIRKYADT
jgi:hypothetical protein